MKTYTKTPSGGKENPCFGYSPERIAGTYAAHSSLTDRECWELERQGVPVESLHRIRAAYIVRTGPAAFELEQHAEHGKPERAFLFLVNDVHGDPSDLIGWQPATGWIGSWRGIAWALNQEAVYWPRLSDHGALKVHRSPLSWLQDNGSGIVLTQANMASAFLCDAGPLLAEDVEHGVELKAALTRNAPRILVSMEGVAQ